VHIVPWKHRHISAKALMLWPPQCPGHEGRAPQTHDHLAQCAKEAMCASHHMFLESTDNNSPNKHGRSQQPQQQIGTANQVNFTPLENHSRANASLSCCQVLSVCPRSANTCFKQSRPLLGAGDALSSMLFECLSHTQLPIRTIFDAVEDARRPGLRGCMAGHGGCWARTR